MNWAVLKQANGAFLIYSYDTGEVVFQDLTSIEVYEHFRARAQELCTKMLRDAGSLLLEQDILESIRENLDADRVAEIKLLLGAK